MENERLKGVCHPCEVPSEVGEKSIAEHNLGNTCRPVCSGLTPKAAEQKQQ